MPDGNDKRRRDKKRRREKRQAKKQAARPPVLARCGGGRPYSRDECLAAADAASARGDEMAGVYAYLADPDKVTIEGSRVVNRADRTVEVSVTVQGPAKHPDGPRQIETLRTVIIPARGFIDFAAYAALPLLILSPLADDAEAMERLQALGGYVAPQPPPALGPWHDAEGLPGIRFTPTYIHNANVDPVKIVAVCRCENEAGNRRCAIFRGAIPGRYLGDVKQMASGATPELLITDAERQAEAAALRASFMADVSAGRMTISEAEDLIAWDDGADLSIEPETVELLAVLPRGCSKREARAIYDQAMRKDDAA